jgi:flagellar protein FliS
MPMTSEISTYLEDQIALATPAKLIDMLFSRAIRDLTTAKEILEDPSYSYAVPDAIREINHAQRIIHELNACLNLKKGGQLAQNLARLYEYFQVRLSEAVLQRNQTSVREVCELLSEIHEGWHSMAEENGYLQAIPA